MPQSPQDIRNIVLRPLTVQFGMPKWLDDQNKPQYIDQWVNALSSYPTHVLTKAVDKAIEQHEFMPKVAQFKKLVQAEMRLANLKTHTPLPAPAKQCPRLRQAVEGWFKANTPQFVGDKLQATSLRTMCTIVAFSVKTADEATARLTSAAAELSNIEPVNREALEAFTQSFSQFLLTQEQ